ncbi:unnamed protein product [Diabrotica balteata]|uniref:Uncharacterized protein n=1 Tax=Diabrotica balteata TaxID=107213 RepID=A0A9N9T5M7_DIABA|nr:unnamed protein product [Diabrotica balteata]
MQERNVKIGILRQYREIINAEFDLAPFKPKKDQCILCTAYPLASTEDKIKLKDRFDKHIFNKIAARVLKDADKEAAIDDKSVCAACFNLLKVLVTPQSSVSSFYYKS